MQRLSLRLSRIIADKAKKHLVDDISGCSPLKQSFSTISTKTSVRKLQQPEIPNDFLKWSSLGFCRTSKFATGFAPLQPKPLDSIMDVERVKDRSTEDIASVWDDVMPHFL